MFLHTCSFLKTTPALNCLMQNASERVSYLAVDLVVAALLRHTDGLVLQLQVGGGGRDGHRGHRGELWGRQRQRRHPHRAHRDLQQPTHPAHYLSFYKYTVTQHFISPGLGALYRV